MPRKSNLTNEDAEGIRRRWAEKPTVKSLAAEYQVSISVIQNILRGQQYRLNKEERLKIINEFTLFPGEQNGRHAGESV